MRDDISDEVFKKLHEEGLSNAQIVKKLKVSFQVVSYRLGKLGLINNNCNVKPSDVKKIIREQAERAKVIKASEIANNLGISQNSVNGILDKMDLSGELP